MQLCSLSIAYAFPYHNPTTTMDHCSKHWHQQTSHPHNTIHTICPIEFKPGFILEEHSSLACQWWAFAHWSQLRCRTTVKTLVRTTSTQMSFPETVSDNLVRNDFHQLYWWLVSGDPTGEARCGGPRLAWLHVVCGCEVGWTYCQIL
jgi:hypothetical protein